MNKFFTNLITAAFFLGIAAFALGMFYAVWNPIQQEKEAKDALFAACAPQIDMNGVPKTRAEYLSYLKKTSYKNPISNLKELKTIGSDRYTNVIYLAKELGDNVSENNKSSFLAPIEAQGDVYFDENQKMLFFLKNNLSKSAQNNYASDFGCTYSKEGRLLEATYSQSNTYFVFSPNKKLKMKCYLKCSPVKGAYQRP